jgi:HEAT repeat protein
MVEWWSAEKIRAPPPVAVEATGGFEPAKEDITMFLAPFLTACLSLCPAGPAPDACAAAPLFPFQDKEGTDRDEQEKKEEEKPPVYPPLSALHKEQVKRLFSQFKNRNPEKRREAEKDMIAIGRGAVPDLLENGDTRHDHQGECIYRCLMALLDGRDLYTLKNGYKSKAPRMRLLSVVKISSLKKPELAEFLKGAMKDEDDKIRLEAALGLLALKDPGGIGEIIEKVAETRKDPPKRLLEDLPLLHGKVYDSLFTPYLIKHENPDVKIAAAQVITAIGDPRLKSVLGRALDDPHNIVKTAAVNALRKLIRNEEPRTFSTVFELVETVDAWKRELGLIR